MNPGDRLPTRILWGFLLLVILGISAAYLVSRFGAQGRAASLPVLGTLPEFSLTERSGRTVSRADMEGRVSVVDFIFTSCSVQCPRVTAQMASLQSFVLPRWKEVRLISLTVDPDRDSPAVLADYAKGFSADPERWWFLTGPHGVLDPLIRNGFRVAAASPVPVDSSPDAILHSISLVLVDPRARVRGYYQSSDPEEMAKLRGDLATLVATLHPTFSIRSLPHLNACLNAVSFCFLLAGYRLIRRGNMPAHRACMLSACGTSLLFFISYVAYHSQVGSIRFPGQGWIRPAYFTLLISHTLLAALVPFLAAVTLFRALRGDFPAHRRIARWTFPIWAYVSLTGVLVYFMLYWVYRGA